MKTQTDRVRPGVQIFFFVLIAAIAVNHSLEEAGLGGLPILSSASLHALCPFGGVVSTYQYATTGTFAKKTHEASFILMWIVFALTLLPGPVFCGWVCPLGSVQEWVGKLGKRAGTRADWSGSCEDPIFCQSTGMEPTSKESTCKAGGFGLSLKGAESLLLLFRPLLPFLLSRTAKS